LDSREVTYMSWAMTDSKRRLDGNQTLNSIMNQKRFFPVRHISDRN
jgi:hypothetical protein